ncbi:hypothetical protein [Streptomyces sp. NPDC001914]|uniref:hypothetical protein n=1 Tax=Streptomyces sp. NPDC001914 TaxID=3364623 RepID=UPI00368C9C00
MARYSAGSARWRTAFFTAISTAIRFSPAASACAVMAAWTTLTASRHAFHWAS